jgi:hypothetical protein
MRKEFAVFAGRKIVAKFFTEREAIAAVKDGQHVRWMINNKWIKVEYSEGEAS